MIINDQVAFVCAAPRSGSTMLHLMLDSHPLIKNPGEFDFMFDLISSDGVLPSPELYENWLSLNRIFLSKNLDIIKSEDSLKIIESFIQQIDSSEPGIALHTFNVHRNFHLIPYVFSHAKYIHLARDPRDVARSSIGMGWAGNVYNSIDQWIKIENDWQKLKAKLNPEQFYEVKYEDLVAEPEVYLKEICNFLNIEFDMDMLSYYQNSTYDKPDKALSYQWKKKQSTREIQYVESKTHELIQQYGYELSGYPLIELSILEKSYLKVQNKMFTIKFNIKKYGLYTYIMSKVIKVVKCDGLVRKTKAKINAIDRLHLK